MKKDNTFAIVVIIVLVLLLFGGFGYGMMGYGGLGYRGMMNYRYDIMGGFYWSGLMWIFGWLLMMLSIFALVLFIIWLVKQLQNSGGKNVKGKQNGK